MGRKKYERICLDKLKCVCGREIKQKKKHYVIKNSHGLKKILVKKTESGFDEQKVKVVAIV